jgi:hypothetical protein
MRPLLARYETVASMRAFCSRVLGTIGSSTCRRYFNDARFVPEVPPINRLAFSLA